MVTNGYLLHICHVGGVVVCRFFYFLLYIFLFSFFFFSFFLTFHLLLLLLISGFHVWSLLILAFNDIHSVQDLRQLFSRIVYELVWFSVSLFPDSSIDVYCWLSTVTAYSLGSGACIGARHFPGLRKEEEKKVVGWCWCIDKQYIYFL